jgi:hypothetical protein
MRVRSRKWLEKELRSRGFESGVEADTRSISLEKLTDYELACTATWVLGRVVLTEDGVFVVS